MNDKDDQAQPPMEDASAQQRQPVRFEQGGERGADRGVERGAERGAGSHRHGTRRRGGGGGGAQVHVQSETRRHDTGINASVNMTELRELVELIATHGFTDFELEREGFRVRLRREQQQSFVAPPSAVANNASPAASPVADSATNVVTQNPSPVAATPASAADAKGSVASATNPSPAASDASATAAHAAPDDSDLYKITSPIVGTFYRSPSPTADPFARIGGTVEPDTVVCIVEAMKLMNEILAETTGTIEKIYVENGQPVEYGQPLFGVRK